MESVGHSEMDQPVDEVNNREYWSENNAVIFSEARENLGDSLHQGEVRCRRPQTFHAADVGQVSATPSGRFGHYDEQRHDLRHPGRSRPLPGSTMERSKSAHVLTVNKNFLAGFFCCALVFGLYHTVISPAERSPEQSMACARKLESVEKNFKLAGRACEDRAAALTEGLRSTEKDLKDVTRTYYEESKESAVCKERLRILDNDIADVKQALFKETAQSAMCTEQLQSSDKNLKEAKEAYYEKNTQLAVCTERLQSSDKDLKEAAEKYFTLKFLYHQINDKLTECDSEGVVRRVLDAAFGKSKRHRISFQDGSREW